MKSLLTLLMLCQLSTMCGGMNYSRDNSDWWSILNGDFKWPEVKSKNEGVANANFKIARVMLDSDRSFRQVKVRLGDAQIITRGDASTGRDQICYSSENESETVHLLFEQGEVDSSFYLLAGGPNWNGSALCVKSNLVSRKVQTGAGLRLGLSLRQVRAILGSPDLIERKRMVYFRQIPQKSTGGDLASFRLAHPEMSDGDFHKNYDFYTLSVYIEARFEDSRLIYLVVSKSEVY